MRLRLFGALFAAAAVAACSGDTTLPAAGKKLAGTWRSNQEAMNLPFPDGRHDVTGEVEVTFTEDGHFHRLLRVTDPSDARQMIVQESEAGTFTVGGGRVLLHVQQSYYRQAGAPTAQITLQPNDRTDEYAVARAGSWLSLTFVCPGWMDCVPPMFTDYQQIFPLTA